MTGTKISVIVCGLLWACEAADFAGPSRAELDAQTRGRILDRTVYVKDTRPNPPVCFGYIQTYDSRAGAPVFVVPCDSIAHLLPKD